MNELAAQFPVTRSAVSQHLGVLAEVGLVTHRKEGRQRFYELLPTGMARLRAEIDRFWNLLPPAMGPPRRTGPGPPPRSSPPAPACQPAGLPRGLGPPAPPIMLGGNMAMGKLGKLSMEFMA